MKKISNIKVIAFDAYGTCFDVNSASRILKNNWEKNGLSFQLYGAQDDLNTAGLEV
jgi:FMN phosphatase YigB (HAD superfamily)